MTDSKKAQTDSSHNLYIIMLAALGVVFGDIGTSPLYALKESFNPSHGVPLSVDAIFGIISIIFWSITIVVTIKYLHIVFRADNKGEGGVLALMAMAARAVKNTKRSNKWLITLGVFGACMFYGDVVITPAISVLSAIEGLSIAAPDLSHYIVPLGIIILFGIFLIQRFGTGTVGKLFGPIMLLWFGVLAILGIYNILKAPSILLALNPYYAFHFMVLHSMQAFTVLGVVVLVLTGAEALYADMGHFGKKPIRRVWIYFVMPALILNYIGQGANLLVNPEAVANPFYHMVPQSLLIPMIILSTFATIIASQAVISGAFSLTSQTILFGFLPRMRILHTSADERGQIYIPLVNWLLCILVIIVAIAFKGSDNLAAAYGIAVTATMLVTSILVTVVMYAVWKWKPIVVILVASCFFIIDLSFFSANLIKIVEGGWLPLLLGGLLFCLFMTWYTGRHTLRARVKDQGIPLIPFVESLMQNPPHRVEGTAVFLTGNVNTVPSAFLHNLKHNRILHERIFFLRVSTWDEPYVDDSKRLALTPLGHDIYQLRAAFGFKEVPDIHKVFELASNQFGMPFELMNTSFFISRETLVVKKMFGWSFLRSYVFAWMFQNGAKSSDFFSIPINRIVELGTKVEI